MNKLLTYYKKYYSFFSYIFFGCLTTAVNFAIYIPLTKVFSLNIVISNITAWFGAVIFAFFTNRRFVFNSQVNSYVEIMKEFMLFILSRILSGGLETIILYVMVTCLGINDLIVKVFAGIVVIIFNYVVSKFFIFNKGK